MPTPTTPTPPPTIFVNDNSREAIAWLRELSNHNHLPPLNLNEHSITDLQPHDLAPHTHVHFFAGIGGWPLALQLAGWPSDQPVWTGSCPCQPFSVAGRGAGTSDPRHLWPQFHRLLSVCLPPVVFGEQVAGAAGREWFAGVRADLEALGYRVGAADLCAASVGAPHIRQRLYWFGVREGVGPIRLADTASDGRQQRGPESDRRGAGGGGTPDPVANSLRPGLEWGTGRAVGDECATAERGGETGGMDNTDSSRLDGAQRNSEGSSRDQARLQVPGAGCSSGRLANTQYDGRRSDQPGRRPEGRTVDGRFGFWGDYSILPCRDGKARRVESGTFPLAYGVPGRVGLLRGYGNAIVVPLAVAFIQAAVETINTTHTG